MGGAAEILASSSADATAIQETRIVDEATKDHENTARGIGWNMAISGCGFGDGGGESSGVAVGCRKHIGLSESRSDPILPKELNTRITVKLGPSAAADSTSAPDTSTPPSAYTTS